MSPTPPFTPEEIQLMLDNLDTYSVEEQAEIHKLLNSLEDNAQVEASRLDLIDFCCYMQPDYIVGKHHRILANLLMEIEQGVLDQGEDKSEDVVVEVKGKDRICVNIPPRHGKSQLVSIYFPAWFLGRNPTMKVMMVSHTTDLAVDFGRKVRNIIATPQYKAIFPNVKLAIDSKSAGR